MSLTRRHITRLIQSVQEAARLISAINNRKSQGGFIKLLDDGILNTDQIEAIDQEATTRVEAAVTFGDASPYPGPETALTDVFVHPLNT